jgi:hypothetical protein
MILLLGILMTLLFAQTALPRDMRVVAVPDRVLVGRSFTLTVSVEWSRAQELWSDYGPPQSVRLEVCEGSK